MPYPVNQRLIAGAQATPVRRPPLSDFLYSRLKLDALAYADDDLVLTSRLGIGLEKVFRRKSGTPLSEPISVLFTRKGFTQIYASLSTQLIAEAGKENWVLGRDNAGLSVREIANIESELRDQYTQDYISTWRQLVLDLELVPFQSEGQAMDALSLITARPSVMREFLDVVAENTAFAATPAEGAEEGEQAGSGSRLSRILGTDTPSAGSVLAAANPGEPIAREFASLNRLVAGQAGAACGHGPVTPDGRGPAGGAGRLRRCRGNDGQGRWTGRPSACEPKPDASRNRCEAG